MRTFLLFLVACVLASATRAEAQTTPAGQAGNRNDSGPGEFNRQQNFREFQVGVTNSNQLTMRPVPALPRDIVQGLEVHDTKGLVIGTVETVGQGFATVTSAIGSVEVDFASFAKNKNGLLINMPKSKIDGLMAGAPPTP